MVKIKVNSRELQFEDGQSLLDGVLDNGLTVKHSCRSGRCNECLAEVQNNSVINRVRSCEYIPQLGDVVEFEKIEDFELPKKLIVPAKINRISKISEKFIKAVFRFPPGKRPTFIPGQYINIHLAGIGYRSYSIASSDKEDTISLLIQKVTGGKFSRYWFETARANDRVTVEGPLGSFFFNDIEVSAVICAATGSGIAPISSMLCSDSFFSKGFYGPLSIYWSLSNPEDLFKLEGISDTSNKISHYTYFTKKQKSGFGRGRIINPIANQLETLEQQGAQKVSILASGNPRFIEDLKSEVSKIQRLKVNVFCDPFLESGDQYS